MSATPIDERWLPVPGFDAYQASDLGAIQSIDRMITMKDGRQRFTRGKVLAQHPSNGYLHVVFSHEGRVTNHWVHRVIAETFLGPCPEGKQVCHGPGGPHDNRITNLRYDAPKENILDSVRDGTHANSIKTECNRGHLLEAPNLHGYMFRVKDVRTCRACAIAASRIGKHPELDRQQEADDAYRLIMAGEMYRGRSIIK